MAEAAIVFGFVILAFAMSWTFFKAFKIILTAKTKSEHDEAPAYLVAAILLGLFAWRLMLSLP
jgi:hypothetical protein